MSLDPLLAQMPKVELHVHFEGSVRPETLLELARRNGAHLPADSVEGLREWYRFRDFAHFVEVYIGASKCIQSADDLDLIAREFIEGLVAQNVRHCEVTYTAESLARHCGIPWPDQREVIRAARAYAAQRNLSLAFILDIVREIPVEAGQRVADWAIAAQADGVVALGLTGIEVSEPIQKHADAFRRAKEAGLRITCHAGESSGPAAIWDCFDVLAAERIGHGIRCLDDPALVARLREDQIPLEVCPSSNVCLGFARSIAEHPIQTMLAQDLNVSVNSDDPPMFDTTLTEEWRRCAEAFAWTPDQILEIQLQTLRAAFATPDEKGEWEAETRAFWTAEVPSA